MAITVWVVLQTFKQEPFHTMPPPLVGLPAPLTAGPNRYQRRSRHTRSSPRRSGTRCSIRGTSRRYRHSFLRAAQLRIFGQLISRHSSLTVYRMSGRSWARKLPLATMDWYFQAVPVEFLLAVLLLRPLGSRHRPQLAVLQPRSPPTSSRHAADRPPTRARRHATPRHGSRCRQPCRLDAPGQRCSSPSPSTSSRATPLVQSKSSWPPPITKSSACTTILIVLAGGGIMCTSRQSPEQIPPGLRVRTAPSCWQQSATRTRRTATLHTSQPSPAPAPSLRTALPRWAHTDGPCRCRSA